MLKATNICKRFGTLEVLQNISLEIGAKEIISIVGASGAGKTTLLQILGTLERPDTGEVALNGINPFELSPKKNFRLSQYRNWFYLPVSPAFTGIYCAGKCHSSCIDQGVSRKKKPKRKLPIYFVS